MKTRSWTFYVHVVVLFCMGLLTSAAPAALPNLALTATATGSTTYSGYPAANANDGNLNTDWSASTWNGGDWLQLEWTSAKTLNTARVPTNQPSARVISGSLLLL